jgi:hypothetical protein
MTRQIIRSALQSRLNSLSPAWPIAWENIKYTPTVGTPWQQAAILFAETAPAGFGADAGEEWSGYLQVTIYSPATKGPKVAEDRADLIRGKAALFYRGLNITKDGLRVIIQQPYDALPIQDADWWALPVRIPFVCYAL